MNKFFYHSNILPLQNVFLNVNKPLSTFNFSFSNMHKLNLSIDSIDRVFRNYFGFRTFSISKRIQNFSIVHHSPSLYHLYYFGNSNFFNFRSIFFSKNASGFEKEFLDAIVELNDGATKSLSNFSTKFSRGIFDFQLVSNYKHQRDFTREYTNFKNFKFSSDMSVYSKFTSEFGGYPKSYIFLGLFKLVFLPKFSFFNCVISRCQPSINLLF